MVRCEPSRRARTLTIPGRYACFRGCSGELALRRCLRVDVMSLISFKKNCLRLFSRSCLSCATCARRTFPNAHPSPKPLKALGRMERLATVRNGSVPRSASRLQDDHRRRACLRIQGPCSAWIDIRTTVEKHHLALLYHVRRSMRKRICEASTTRPPPPRTQRSGPAPPEESSKHPEHHIRTLNPCWVVLQPTRDGSVDIPRDSDFWDNWCYALRGRH